MFNTVWKDWWSSIEGSSERAVDKIGDNEYFTCLIEGVPSYVQDQKLYLNIWPRIETLGRTLNFLIGIDRAVACKPMAGFAAFPLPAKRAPWEAHNTEICRTGFEMGLRTRRLFGLADSLNTEKETTQSTLTYRKFLSICKCETHSFCSLVKQYSDWIAVRIFEEQGPFMLQFSAFAPLILYAGSYTSSTNMTGMPSYLGGDLD